jgi:hypothetical protein
VVTVSRAPDGAAGEVANVTVAQVPSRAEADLIAGLLSSSGVRSFVLADDAGGQQPQLQIDGVRVLVGRSDEAAARQLLAEAEAAAADENDDR